MRDCNEDDLEWVPCDCGEEDCFMQMQVCHNCEDTMARECDEY